MRKHIISVLCALTVAVFAVFMTVHPADADPQGFRHQNQHQFQHQFQHQHGLLAPVEQTGQTVSYATGDDGDWQAGVVPPEPRFTNNEDGTVRDKLTHLIWTLNADLFGQQIWSGAVGACNGLADDGSDTSPVKDGSQAGDWRLANVKELESLMDYGQAPYLPPAHPFEGVQNDYYYWSSTTTPTEPLGDFGWAVRFSGAIPVQESAKDSTYSVWCVRGGY